MFSKFTIQDYKKGRKNNLFLQPFIFKNLILYNFMHYKGDSVEKGLCFFYISLEIGKKDTECSNGAQAQRRVCPKVYFCTSKGVV